MAVGIKASIVWALLLAAAAASMANRPAVAQSFVDGYWNPLSDEDYDERYPGPDQGDYAGLPVTNAAVAAAQTYNPELLTEEAIQCRPHPSIYGFRGVGMLRVWEDRDPYTQEQTQIETWIAWQAQHRHIFMDGRAHPPWWAPHSWEGFSTGYWVGDVLHVHTDQLMAAWTRRNGVPTDDRASMDEVWFRYGTVLTHIMIISDKQYLTEPLVKSNEFVWVPQAGMGPYPCRPADEIPRNAGIVPMYLPDHHSITLEWAVRNDVPIQASYGGADTEMPEYQDVLKSLPPNPPLKGIEERETHDQQVLDEVESGQK